jgi:hypothetical protein
MKLINKTAGIIMYGSRKRLEILFSSGLEIIRASPAKNKVAAGVGRPLNIKEFFLTVNSASRHAEAMRKMSGENKNKKSVNDAELKSKPDFP